MSTKLMSYVDPVRWRGAAEWLTRQGVPVLATLSVIVTLYLAPTKDPYANQLLAVLAVFLLASRRLQLSDLLVLRVLLPLGVLGLYALVLQVVYPLSNAAILIERLAIGAGVMCVFYAVFASMRLGRQYLWVVFLFIIPAAVHLLYMYVDIGAKLMEQDVVYIEQIKDMPRTGRRYLSHALVPLLFTAFLVGSRLRAAFWLALVFMAGIALPAMSLALLDARAAYVALIGTAIAVTLIGPMRREFGRCARRWAHRVRWFYPALALLAVLVVLMAYTSGKARWTATASSLAAAAQDVRSGDADRDKKPPFADMSYWNRPVETRCADNSARCLVDQSMYLRSAWALHALGQLRQHPFGLGQRDHLMSFETQSAPSAADRSGNTAGDNFLIEAALAFGIVGLALYAWLWLRVVGRGVSAIGHARRRGLQVLLVTLIGTGILRSFVDVMSYGLWYYWMALVGIMFGTMCPSRARRP